MKKIRIIEIKSELGAGTRGASLGVDAVKIAALDYNSTYFKTNETLSVPVPESSLLLEPVANPYAKRIKGLHAVCERAATAVKEVLGSENTFPIILAGDHSASIGTVSGVRMAFPNKRLGLIWIDAHADIHSPYTTPSGNLHGMPISCLLGEDNLEYKINTPDAETVAQWESLKHLGSIYPKIAYSDIVYVAVRDVEVQEEHLIRKHKIPNFTVAEIRRKGIEKTAIEILGLLDHCDLIFISFDVDSMDAAISKGTGTPVMDGITEKEAGTLIVRLLSGKKICGFEMVEINPTLDKENLMAENAFEILSRATNQLKNEF